MARHTFRSDTPSGLCLPASEIPASFKYRARERVVVDPRSGQKYRVWTDDSGTCEQIEDDDHLHARGRLITATRGGGIMPAPYLPAEARGRPTRTGGPRL